MNIRYALLGYLSWRSLSGYDLKKLIADSSVFYWSGNNNQIYKTLIQLHQEGLVQSEILDPASLPVKKVYTITNVGLCELRKWILSEPTLPEYKNSFLIQLAWADLLNDNEITHLIDGYEEIIQNELLILRSVEQKSQGKPNRTPREIILWEMISENSLSAYTNELQWIKTLRQRLLMN